VVINNNNNNDDDDFYIGLALFQHPRLLYKDRFRQWFSNCGTWREIFHRRVILREKIIF